jgi:hypothetical protein
MAAVREAVGSCELPFAITVRIPARSIPALVLGPDEGCALISLQ